MLHQVLRHPMHQVVHKSEPSQWSVTDCVITLYHSLIREVRVGYFRLLCLLLASTRSSRRGDFGAAQEVPSIVSSLSLSDTTKILFIRQNVPSLNMAGVSPIEAAFLYQVIAFRGSRLTPAPSSEHTKILVSN